MLSCDGDGDGLGIVTALMLQAPKTTDTIANTMIAIVFRNCLSFILHTYSLDHYIGSLHTFHHMLGTSLCLVE